MKKQIILIAMMMVTSFGYVAKAQVSLQVNIGTQPLWGPTGYDHASYYYLPDIDAYYDVQSQQYVYLEGGTWVTRPNLPPQYASYDLYHGYKAVINAPTPWLHNATYRAKYGKYKGRHDQHVIRDSHEDKYRANPNHPEHNQWHGGQNQPNQHQPHQVQPHQNQPHPNQQHQNQQHQNQPNHNDDHHDNGHHDEHGGH